MWIKGHKKIWLDLPLMIDSAFCAGAAMITFGAILGKVSPTQLTYLLVLEVCEQTEGLLHMKLLRIAHCLTLGQTCVEWVGGWVGGCVGEWVNE